MIGKERRHESDLLEMAKAVAFNSPDPSTKVGAVLFWHDGSEEPSEGGRYLSGQGIVGWNHIPGVPTDSLYYLNRESKYPRVIHAEVHALLSAGRSGLGWLYPGVAYVTHPPCSVCATCLAVAGIRTVHAGFGFHSTGAERKRFLDTINWKISLDIFRANDIQFVGYGEL